MSLFRRTRPGTEDVERIKSEVAQLRELVGNHAQRADQLEERLYRAPTSTDGVDGSEQLGDAHAVGGSPDAELTARLDALAAQVTDLDGRITSVSGELAAQLNELGGEIEQLSKRSGAEPDEAQLDGLRDAQTRLANEQARYQIAFREDLARLVEQLRRP